MVEKNLILVYTLKAYGYCKFLILRECFRCFVLNRKNMKLRAPVFCYNFT